MTPDEAREIALAWMEYGRRHVVTDRAEWDKLKDAAAVLESQAETIHETRAREAEIAKVREEMEQVAAGHPPLWSTAKGLPAAVKAWADRLGGETPRKTFPLDEAPNSGDGTYKP